MYLGFRGNSPPKKQRRRWRGFTAYFSQNQVNVVAAGRFPVFEMLIFLNFFKDEGLDHQNMTKPIPIGDHQTSAWHLEVAKQKALDDAWRIRMLNLN